MKELCFEIKNKILAEVLSGCNIRETIEEASEIATKYKTVVQFKFNGKLLTITESTDIDKEVQNYFNK